MLFNSIDYAIFLPIVFFLYWFVTERSLKFQNILLLVVSYYFYACWDARFLLLLIFSTLLDYYAGLNIAKAKNHMKRKIWLWLSVGINLAFLGVFKYYNFFADSFAAAISNVGLQVNPATLNIILPLGISFYTFHGLSYIIDVYNDKISAEKNFVDYGVFVSFFPLLIAGPIARANHLLPQIKKKRRFDYAEAVDGLRQILWGLFKKIVVADNCAIFADEIFNNSASYPGSTLILGAIFFAFQIYGDFSGYSDVAVGTSRLFGIELLRNFAFPYFSRDIAEFWRRWNISLSTWFRDYLYVPLGGSRGSMWIKIRNTFIIFLVSGFWHGADWTFIVWGALNAFYFLPLLLTEKNRQHLGIVAQGKSFPTLNEAASIVLTFGLTVFAWIFFRAENLSHAISYINEILSPSTFTLPEFPGLKRGLATLMLTGIFMLMEWRGRDGQHALSHFGLRWWKPFRWAFYVLIAVTTLLYSGSEEKFIYFQF
jgi:D-alanyl-lipoteichoic acid acyltransferase DltB (MBOAT superfamily)